MTIRFSFPEKYSYINKLAISPDGSKFATCSSSSLVQIQGVVPDVVPVILPRPTSAITSLGFLTGDVLALTLAENNRLLLFERHGSSWDLHPWCQEPENMPSKIRGVMDKCQGTFAVNGDTSQVWMWGANWLAWVKPGEEQVAVTPKSKGKSKAEKVTKEKVKKKKVKEENAKKEKEKEEELKEEKVKEENEKRGVVEPEVETSHWVIFRYREVLLMDCLGSAGDSMEFVVVERPRHEILEDITESRFYRHEYGT
jgi:hypothetical protein